MEQIKRKVLIKFREVKDCFFTSFIFINGITKKYMIKIPANWERNMIKREKIRMSTSKLKFKNIKNIVIILCMKFNNIAPNATVIEGAKKLVNFPSLSFIMNIFFNP